MVIPPSPHSTTTTSFPPHTHEPVYLHNVVVVQHPHEDVSLSVLLTRKKLRYILACTITRAQASKGTVPDPKCGDTSDQLELPQPRSTANPSSARSDGTAHLPSHAFRHRTSTIAVPPLPPSPPLPTPSPIPHPISTHPTTLGGPANPKTFRSTSSLCSLPPPLLCCFPSPSTCRSRYLVDHEHTGSDVVFNRLDFDRMAPISV